ncbi:MAG: TonB-dependent receptor plug domain-containing protein [Treponema sp.]|nr:TonB-dependent receptor plug domain-containing protein [Treponema sp.]
MVLTRHFLFRLFFLSLLFACLFFLNAEDVTSEHTDDFDDWIIMEGQGLTIEEDAPRQETSPALPEQSAFGMRKNIVSEEQIQQQGSIDFSDTLKNVPGVIVGQKNMAGTTTGSSIFVRGRGYAHPATEVAVHFDGVPRYGFLYGQSMADSIPVITIDHVEVFKSPQPSEFGAGYALVNVQPRSMNEEGWIAEGGFSGGSYYTFVQNAAFGVQLGRFDIFAAQSWTSTNGHIVHSGAQQQSYYLNTGMSINEHWDLRLLGNYAGAHTEQAPYAGQSIDDILSSYQTNSIFSTITLNNEYDKAEGFLKLYYTNTQFKWLDENPHIPGEWSLQSLQAFGARARETLTVLEKGNAVLGMDLDWMLMVNEDHNITRPSIITTFPAMILYSPYAGASWLFGDREQWHITPSAGLRGFFHSVWANQLSYQGGLVLGWKRLDCNFNYSRGLVYPAPAILQPLLGNAAAYESADLKRIEPETIDHFEAGLRFAPRPRTFFSYALDGSYFYNVGKNRIIVTSQVPGNASSLASFTLQGLELAASVDFFPEKLFANTIGIFAGGTWYTDVSATDEKGNTVKKMPFTPTFSLSAGFRWVFLDNFYLSGDLQYLHDLYTGWLSPSSAPAAAHTLNDIFLLNLRLGFNFTKTQWRLADSELFISVNNVCNTQYEYYTGYVMPGITYMLGCSFRFK